MGMVPNVFMRPMEPSVNRVIELVTGQQSAQVRNSVPSVERLPGAGSRSDSRAPTPQRRAFRASSPEPRIASATP
jgi:hypothetical protein